VSKSWSVVEAFAHFNGAKCNNVRWSWSARDPSGCTVVLALWQHMFDYKSRPATYSTFGQPDVEKDGNKERIENLKWARDHCRGLFRVVIAVAKDKKAERWEAAIRYPARLIMRLVELDETSGEFRAEMVTTLLQE
jgi:hypothetical protein